MLPCGSERSPKARIRLQRINQGIKKHLAVAVRKHKRFMPGHGVVRRLRQRCQAKVCKASAFQRSSSFHQLLGLGVYAKTETRAPSAALFRTDWN